MSDTGGEAPRSVSCALGTVFELEPGKQEEMCVDLEGEWREDSIVIKHPDLNIDNLELVLGCVGEGGDHVNISFKNTGAEKITIDEDQIVIEVREKLPASNEEESMDVDDGNKEPATVNPQESSAEVAESSDVSEENKQTKHTLESSEDSCEKCDDVRTDAPEKQDEAQENLDKKKSSSDDAFDQLFSNYTTDEPKDNNVDNSKDTDTAPETEEIESNAKEASDSDNPNMKLVNETSAEDKDNEEPDNMDTETETVSSNTNGDAAEKSGDDKSGDEADKPTLKLASFSSMATSTENGHSNEEADEGCYFCKKSINNLFEAIIWEAMPFCDESCLANYQMKMSNCASCNKEVATSSLGKYCVRFGCDIKQFCSNTCLEDYKKGLKVCSYCQKDISGGEGFLAPIGDKGQFKDFCQQKCLQKFQHMHYGKIS